jgi:hypothetical protein
MKTLAPALLTLAALLPGTAGPPAKATFHVAIATLQGPMAEDSRRGVEALVKAYGETRKGGLILSLLLPDTWDMDPEPFLASLTQLTEDPLMKAVVVYQAVPGTAEAFKRIHAKRPDIYCLAGQAHEDPAVITASADLVVNQDFISRGYTLPWAAKEMGAKTFVHISFARHLALDSIGRQRAILEDACQDLGLRFAAETSLDPLLVGAAASQQFILDKVPGWLKHYGGDTERVAFFCTQDGQTGPLLKRLLESKHGLFVEADLPSPLMGYPAALGLDLSKEKSFPAMLKRIESAVVTKGGAGRFGTWAFSFGHSVTAGLGEYAIRVLKGTARKNHPEGLFAAMAQWTPGTTWNGALYVDTVKGKQYPNEILVYADTYVLGGLKGKHSLATTRLKIPEKYFALKKH